MELSIVDANTIVQPEPEPEQQQQQYAMLLYKQGYRVKNRQHHWIG